ncbi:MAG: methyltransferase domain-containing protein [Fibrobacteria bacterium]
MFKTIEYSNKEKYRIVADWLMRENGKGSLLDIGARDRKLLTYLKGGAIKYFSADLIPGHDYRLDLEAKLPFEDGHFAYTVALDVIEHVERIHDAFAELARITSDTMFIALPNMSALSRRKAYLFRGNLGTTKYSLLPDHQGDRHRWLTVYHEMNAFVESSARKAGMRAELMVECMEGGPVGQFITRMGKFRNGLFCERCVYVLRRETVPEGKR